MASDWFYEKNGARHGPVSAAELRAMCADGRLAPSDLVWKETLPRWVKAAQLAGVRFNDDDPFASTSGSFDTAGRGQAGVRAQPQERDSGGAADKSGSARWGRESSPASPSARRGGAGGGSAPALPGDLADDAGATLPEGGRALFQHPVDGRRRVVAPGRAFLGCLLLGPLYFFLLGNRRQALWSLGLLPLTLGISHFVYPFLAPGLMRAMYREQGWKRLA
jgi:hypothetical protein